MNKFRDLLTRLFAPHQSLPAGMFHYQTPPDAPHQYRLHLRIENDGTGLLILNASTVMHLNPTATEMMYHMVNGSGDEQAITEIVRRYRVDPAQARQDYLDLKARLDYLISTPDLDPVTYLDFERSQPHSERGSAPLRLDCALTYRQSDSAYRGLAPEARVKRELNTEEWQSILDKAWAAAIPHAIFTGGEPTLRPDLPELIAHAEKLGMVTGLLTDGLRLAETTYLHQLLASGLDHVMLLLDPHHDESWEALRDVLAEDLHATIHLTLTPRIDDALPLIDKLAELGVTHISLSASDPALNPALQAARDRAAEKHMTLVWDVPVPYSLWHPVALDDSAEHISGAGSAWLYVEPDGDVLPGQGINHVLGNLLNDPFEQIWSLAGDASPASAEPA